MISLGPHETFNCFNNAVAYFTILIRHVYLSLPSFPLLRWFCKGYDTNWKGRRVVCNSRDSFRGEHNAIRLQYKSTKLWLATTVLPISLSIEFSSSVPIVWRKYRIENWFRTILLVNPAQPPSLLFSFSLSFSLCRSLFAKRTGADISLANQQCTVERYTFSSYN